MMNRHTLKGICFFILLAAFTHYNADCQDRKGTTVIILNGDTTINGKKLSKVSKEERELLLKDFKNSDDILKVIDGTGIFLAPDSKTGDLRDMVIKRGRNSDGFFSFGDSSKLKQFRFEGGPGARFFKFDGDSLFASIGDSSFFKNFRFNFDDPISVFRDRSSAFGGRNADNSQTFSYRNTDKDGFSTSVSFRVSDASKETVEKIAGIKGTINPLDVQDFTLFPNFSSGKTTLSFNLPVSSKSGSADIKILDSNLNLVATQNFPSLPNSGNYTKQLILPKNGVYYVAINQGGSWFVKKIVKM